jgi:hypothetical protein
MLQKGYLQYCPLCGKKGVHMDEDGHPRCKYCCTTFGSWADIPKRKSKGGK